MNNFGLTIRTTSDPNAPLNLARPRTLHGAAGLELPNTAVAIICRGTGCVPARGDTPICRQVPTCARVANVDLEEHGPAPQQVEHHALYPDDADQKRGQKPETRPLNAGQTKD